VDGQVGPVTLKALQDDWNTGPAAVLQEMTSVRIAYYKSLGQPEFVNGWIRRANDCYAAGLAMISPPVQS
jgi:lysozyme family protein